MQKQGGRQTQGMNIEFYQEYSEMPPQGGIVGA
jgi:hypothetical protein